MTRDFTGFNFLPSSMHPVAEIRRGYETGSLALSDMGVTSKAGVSGAAITIDANADQGVNLVHHMFRLDI